QWAPDCIRSAAVRGRPPAWTGAFDTRRDRRQGRRPLFGLEQLSGVFSERQQRSARQWPPLHLRGAASSMAFAVANGPAAGGFDLYAAPSRGPWPPPRESVGPPRWWARAPPSPSLSPREFVG